MVNQKEELMSIITKFAESGWDLIANPSKVWLKTKEGTEASETVFHDLVQAIKQADKECGSCGCEFDPLYKRALCLLLSE